MVGKTAQLTCTN